MTELLRKLTLKENLIINVTFDDLGDQNLRIISQLLDGESYKNLRETHKFCSQLELTNNNDLLKLLVKK